MRTLTAYGIGVVIVLAVLNAIAWQAGTPRLHSLNVFSAGFVLGMLGTPLPRSSTATAGSPDPNGAPRADSPRVRPEVAGPDDKLR